MEVSLGILIVGSLYWDGPRHRSQWRNERLDIEAKRGVLAPIRYGRSSDKRGNTYTMVFSEMLARDEVKLGTAIFVPCKSLVRTVEDLVEEAEILWAAERKSGASNGCISAHWGCVGLAVNPDRPIPDDLRRGWGKPVIAMAFPMRSYSIGRDCSTTMGSRLCTQRKRSIIGRLQLRQTKTLRAVRLGSLFSDFLAFDFLPGFSSKPNYLGQFAAPGSIFRSHHRIV